MVGRNFINLCFSIAWLQAGTLMVNAQEFVDRTPQIIEMGIMSNYPDGQFHPERVLSRAELATILVKTFGLNLRNSKPSNSIVLTDVSPEHWALLNIQQVVQKEIMTLDDRGRFLPDQPVTRAAGFAAFAQAYGLFYVTDAEIATILAPYPDSTEIPQWGRRAIATAIFEGLVNIDPEKNLIEPNKLMTREDMVYTLSEYLLKQQNPGTIPTIPLD